MNELTIQVVAGLIVASVAAFVGYFVRKRSEDKSIIPGKAPKSSKKQYERLRGRWQIYYLTRHLNVSLKPFWIHGHQDIKIDDYGHVSGNTHLVEHPLGELRYEAVGDVRGGRMIINDNSVNDETEFASFSFHDLRPECLVGIWTGLDNQRHLIAAPVVLSRNKLSASELNKMMKGQPLCLVSGEEDFELYREVQSRIMISKPNLVSQLKQNGTEATSHLLMACQE
jgi:hypothetical protein